MSIKNEKSRTFSSARNAIFNLFSYCLTIGFAFIVRTIFIKVLSNEYLGINGLFTNILSMLSLAELGIGNAIVFRLYKPLLDEDENKIRELMNFYKMAYRLIAIIVGIIGLAMLPFLDCFMSEVPQINESLQSIYLLYLSNSVLSYLLIYKKSMLIAAQMEYITDIVEMLCTAFLSALQIFVLIFFKNFVLYLSIQIVVTIIQNLINTYICNKKYPYLKNNHKHLPIQEKRLILYDVKALILYRFSGIIISSTDNLILAKFVSIVSVGLYSNYYLIINALYSLIKRFLMGCTASIGNLNATDEIDKQEKVYNSVLFMAAYIYGCLSVCLVVLINPFIEIWVGENFIFDYNIVVVLIINFYLLGITQTYNIFRNTFGLFIQGQYRPIISALINLILSLILVQYFEIFGVFLGTTISYLVIYIWYDPYIVYKYALKKSVKKFYLKSLAYFLANVIIAAVIFLITSLIKIPNLFLDFVVKAIFCIIFSILLFGAIFCKTKEFKYLINTANMILTKKNIYIFKKYIK